MTRLPSELRIDTLLDQAAFISAAMAGGDTAASGFYPEGEKQMDAAAIKERDCIKQVLM